MALSVNKVTILGNLGQDPEIRSFANGGRVANLTVATSRRWKSRATGEIEERTEWHRVSITADGLVGVAEDRLRKGGKVYIEGRLETRKWQDRAGADRWSTEIVVAPYEGELIALDRATGEGAGAPGGAGRGAGAGAPPPALDDEIPF